MKLGRISIEGVPVYCRVEPDGCHVLGEGEPETAKPTGVVVPADAAVFLPPALPTKVLAVLGAFRKGRSAKEARARTPVFTSKLSSCVNAHLRPVVAPFDARFPIVGEAELGVVLDRDLRRVTVEEARAAILGLTCVNDVTLAGYGEEDHDYVRAKSIDTFGPFGPWVETDFDLDEVAAGLIIRGYVNGKKTQEGTTAEYSWSVPETISWASQFFTLRRFDLISLGTPTPTSPIAAGDEMTVEVEHVGTLTNPIVSEVRRVSQ
jgi:2-keto-4-pentenoate hydratase/2-oxohepta-3-ene-1,7-dioic acid hydratase in catechol pathway